MKGPGNLRGSIVTFKFGGTLQRGWKLEGVSVVSPLQNNYFSSLSFSIKLYVLFSIFFLVLCIFVCCC